MTLALVLPLILAMGWSLRWHAVSSPTQSAFERCAGWIAAMSVQYKPVGWVRTKLFYDAVLIAGIAAYLFAFLRLAPASRPVESALDEQSLAIKAYGSCAFILLTLVLAIGPLARLDQRFLPLLYNRRHFGVMTCAVAGAHVTAVLGWYFAYSPLDPWVAVFCDRDRLWRVAWISLSAIWYRSIFYSAGSCSNEP